MSPISVDHLAVISIRTTRLHETVHFYRDLVGLSLLAHHGQHPAFDLGNGLFFAIIPSDTNPPGKTLDPRFPILAFAVQDLDVVVQQLKAHQIELPWGIESDQRSQWVQCLDPGGNLIEFVQFFG